MPLADDFRSRSRDRWRASAAGWEEQQEHIRTHSMPVSAWLVDAVDPQPGQTLAELAAGVGDTGLLAAELLVPGGELICSDFSPEMLAAARRRAEQLGIGNVRFKQIDADTSIDVAAASIDGVICRWGYMLMADPGNALRETRRILRPGGRVALAAWTAAEDNPWMSLPHQLVSERALVEPADPDEPGPFAWAQEGVIGEQLIAAGFADPEVEPLAFEFTFRSGSDWWTKSLGMSSTFARAIGQASDELRDVCAQAFDRYAERFAQPDGSLRVPARTWVARATA